MVARGDGKFRPWGWPQNPSKPKQCGIAILRLCVTRKLFLEIVCSQCSSKHFFHPFFSIASFLSTMVCFSELFVQNIVHCTSGNLTMQKTMLSTISIWLCGPVKKAVPKTGILKLHCTFSPPCQQHKNVKELVGNLRFQLIQEANCRHVNRVVVSKLSFILYT